MKNLYRITAPLMTIVLLANVTACSGTSGNSNSQSQTETTQTETAKEVDLEKIHVAVMDVYGEDYIPVSPFDAQAMKDLFGISSDLYDSYIAEGPMMSVQIDNFVAVKAKNGKGEEVEKLLKDYREYLVNDSIQYPSNLAKVQASEVIRHGDYVFFVMLGTPSMEAEEKGEEEALKSAEENNQKAVDAINAFF